MMQAQVVSCNFRSFAVTYISLQDVFYNVISLPNENHPLSTRFVLLHSVHFLALQACESALTLRLCIFGLTDCPQEASPSSALHSHATGRFSGISFASVFLLGLFLFFWILFQTLSTAWLHTCATTAMFFLVARSNQLRCGLH